MSRLTFMGNRLEVFALAHEGIKQGAIAARVGARQVSPKDNTSARPCIAEDGPTGSFLECSGLNSVDEKSVGNEGWSHNG